MDEDNGHVTYKHQYSEVCDVFVESKNERARNTILSNDPSNLITTTVLLMEMMKVLFSRNSDVKT